MGLVSKTNTSVFMVPTLRINREQLTLHNFIDAYICDPNRDMEYGDCVFLLFRPKNLEKFQDFVEDEYTRTKQLIDDYDYDNGIVVLVYLLNPEFKEDFEKIKKGKYSRTSKEFQELFPKIVKIPQKNGGYVERESVQHRIFTKADDLRLHWEDRIGNYFTPDMEVWDGFDVESETLNLEKVKNYV